MAKYQSKSNYSWKTSRTTIEDNSRRTSGTINELRAFEEQLGLVNRVPERSKKTSTEHPLSKVSAVAAAEAVKADETAFAPAVDRAPEPEKLKTEEVHEVRNLITKDEENKTIEKVKKHLDNFIAKGSVIKRQDALSIAEYAFKLGMIYHQKGSIDKYLEKK